MVHGEKMSRCALDWRDSCCKGGGKRAGDLSGEAHRLQAERVCSVWGHYGLSAPTFHLPDVVLWSREIGGSE